MNFPRHAIGDATFTAISNRTVPVSDLAPLPYPALTNLGSDDRSVLVYLLPKSDVEGWKLTPRETCRAKFPTPFIDSSEKRGKFSAAFLAGARPSRVHALTALPVQAVRLGSVFIEFSNRLSDSAC